MYTMHIFPWEQLTPKLKGSPFECLDSTCTSKLYQHASAILTCIESLQRCWQIVPWCSTHFSKHLVPTKSVILQLCLLYLGTQVALSQEVNTRVSSICKGTHLFTVHSMGFHIIRTSRKWAFPRAFLWSWGSSDPEEVDESTNFLIGNIMK